MLGERAQIAFDCPHPRIGIFVLDPRACGGAEERHRSSEAYQTFADLRSEVVLAPDPANDAFEIVAGPYANLTLARRSLAKDLGRHGVQFRAAPLKQIGGAIDDDFRKADKPQDAAVYLPRLLGATRDETAKRLRLRIAHRDQVLRRDHEGHGRVLWLLVRVPSQERGHVEG